VPSAAGGSGVLPTVGGLLDAGADAVVGEPPLGGAMSWWVGAHAARATTRPTANAVRTGPPGLRLAGAAVRRDVAARAVN